MLSLREGMVQHGLTGYELGWAEETGAALELVVPLDVELAEVSVAYISFLPTMASSDWGRSTIGARTGQTGQEFFFSLPRV